MEKLLEFLCSVLVWAFDHDEPERGQMVAMVLLGFLVLAARGVTLLVGWSTREE